MTEKVNVNGDMVDISVAIAMMDDDIREILHQQGYDNNAEFVAAYIEAHRDVFGSDFRCC